MPRYNRPARAAGAFVVAVAAAMTACAGVALEARPEQIPSLERTVERSPRDLDAATRLGIAYYAADRFEDARTTLQRVIDGGGREGAAYLYLGLANEELEDWAAARAAYDQYLQTGTSSRVKNQIRGRLALVARKELRQQARLALQQEAILSEQPPTRNTIAVLPFSLTGVSDDLMPLQTALADMIITDLSIARLQSLERIRVQSMVDEMVLAQAGLTTRETGARMGRLLKAEHVVQGALSGAGNEIVLDAAILNTAQQATAGEVNRRGETQAIFDLEKQIVFGILDALNIQITAQERELITNNRTANLVAFIAYGRGLEALDRGDYAEALTQFQQAATLDPNFSAARSQQTQAQQMSTAANTAPEQIAEVGVIEIQAPATGSMTAEIVNQVNYSPASTVAATSQSTTTTSTSTSSTQSQERKPQSEPTSQPPISQAQKATITIIIPRPGGQP